MALLTGEPKSIFFKKAVNVYVRKGFFQSVLSGSATRCQFVVAEIIFTAMEAGTGICGSGALGQMQSNRLVNALPIVVHWLPPVSFVVLAFLRAARVQAYRICKGQAN